MAAKFDKKDNAIGDGSFHVNYTIEVIEGATSSVSKSQTTESVYVTYSFGEKSVTVRFSNHNCNAVTFGDQLNGYIASREEIMFALGLATRTFTPVVSLVIEKRQVSKATIANYEEANVTIQEIYAMGAGADLSSYCGKLAKRSNWLITGTKITESKQYRQNALGQQVEIGTYTYSAL